MLNRGDPAPTNVVQDAKGNLYWTCRSAGVIVMQTPTPDPDYNNATQQDVPGLAKSGAVLF